MYDSWTQYPCCVRMLKNSQLLNKLDVIRIRLSRTVLRILFTCTSPLLHALLQHPLSTQYERQPRRRLDTGKSARQPKWSPPDRPIAATPDCFWGGLGGLSGQNGGVFCSWGPATTQLADFSSCWPSVVLSPLSSAPRSSNLNTSRPRRGLLVWIIRSLQHHRLT